MKSDDGVELSVREYQLLQEMVSTYYKLHDFLAGIAEGNGQFDAQRKKIVKLLVTCTKAYTAFEHYQNRDRYPFRRKNPP